MHRSFPRQSLLPGLFADCPPNSPPGPGEIVPGHVRDVAVTFAHQINGINKRWVAEVTWSPPEGTDCYVCCASAVNTKLKRKTFVSLVIDSRLLIDNQMFRMPVKARRLEEISIYFRVCSS